MEMKKLPTIVVGMVFVLMFFFASAVLPQSSGEKMLVSREAPIRIENHEGAPLIIQEAKVKVITRAEYQQLMRLPTDQGADSDEYASFPTVTLINVSSQRVIGFALGFTGKEPRPMHILRVSGISIEPNGVFTVTSDKWGPSGKQLVVSSGSVVEATVTKGTGQSQTWFADGAASLLVRVGVVEFEDGRRLRIGK